MELDQDRHEDAASPPAMPAPSMPTTGFAAQIHEASRMRPPGLGSGNGPSITTALSNGMGPSHITEHDARLGLEIKFPSLDLAKVRKPVKYRECLKNHAASLGGHALDGCGEFMPSGSEGTLEALKCAACDCHRNFHRREVEGEKDQHKLRRLGPLLPAPPPMALMPAPAPPGASQMIMALGGPRPDFDDPDHGGPLLSPHHSMHSSGGMLRKRFRTKFTSEQKERMWDFAEKLGWRIQKHDDQAVQQFCAEVGVKRHVLKVWMHNNKNTLGKKPSL
ncbi:hypothetical protein GOP47_0029927 [Adiantum capillus-veneris]|nr:hypothetical protein GOP47_0029927 [Adiantum capillus-veneris]